MESSGEGGGELGLGFTKIEVTSSAAEGLGKSDILHIVKEILGFVLYMHHQIPAVLQNLEDEFDSLKEEYKGLESISPPTEFRASFQRKHGMRKREVKQGIRRLEKLMNAISSLFSALQQAFDETYIEGVTLVLGSSLVRPQHVYEILFSQERATSGNVDCVNSKVADALSRKAIRALISKGAGTCSYTGPSKLFLLVKSPCTFNLPLQFFPKRDYRYSKKIIPYKLQIKCKISLQVEDSRRTPEVADSTCLTDFTLTDMIWFQCKHTIKGLPSKAPVEE